MNGSAFNWVMENFIEFRTIEKKHTAAIRGIQRVLRNQAKWNRTSAYFLIAVGAYAVIANKRLDAQKSEIEKLTKEVEELKQMKGE